MTIGIAEAIVRLVVAALLSGVIGFEREVAQKAAGLRTHMLVGLGAGLFALLSVEGFTGSDPARVAAQIVAGVGFLGAGAIFRHGFSVRGLTTAAGLWTAAAVGMATGIGEFAIAMIATAVAVVVLFLFGTVEWLARGRRDLASAIIGVDVIEGGAVQGVCDRARALVGPPGTVVVQEITVEGATVRLTVEPRLVDEVMLSLHTDGAVGRVYRVDI
ncbi:MAG: MgtC/SapB family protein [Acidimicrobiia bacterium]